MQYSAIGWFIVFTLGLFIFLKLKFKRQIKEAVEAVVARLMTPTKRERDTSTTPTLSSLIVSTPKLMNRLCPHNNVVQSFEVEQKDSLDEHLDTLAQKLGEKESKLLMSKTKIRQTQNEIDNLQTIDHVRSIYKNIMETLKTELLTNEKDCKALQHQIEWVSKRRAELQDEVTLTQKEFGENQAELLSMYRNKMESIQSNEVPPWQSLRQRHQNPAPMRPSGTTVPTFLNPSSHTHGIHVD